MTPDDLEHRVAGLAEELLAIPFTALRRTNRQINRAFEQDLATLMEEMIVAEEDFLCSPEHVAVMAAYLEAWALGKKRGKEELRGLFRRIDKKGRTLWIDQRQKEKDTSGIPGQKRCQVRN